MTDKSLWVHDDGYGSNGMGDIIVGVYHIIAGVVGFILAIFRK